MFAKITIEGFADLESEVDYPIQETERADCVLETGGFKITGVENSKPIPEYTKCTTSFDGVARQWYCNSNVEQIRFQFKPYIYAHTVSLIEPLKILQSYPMPNLTFIKPLQQTSYSPKPYTYWTALQRVRNIIPLEVSSKHSATRAFDLDPSMQTYLDKIPFPESFPVSKNVLEFVLQIGRALGIRPRLVNYRVLTFNLNENLREVYNSGDYYTDVIESDLESYCTEIESVASNMVSENSAQETVKYPGKDMWVNVRSGDESGRLTNDNAVFITPSPIQINGIKKFIVKEAVVTYVYWDEKGNRLTKTETFTNLDISKYVLETKERNVLKRDSSSWEDPQPYPPRFQWQFLYYDEADTAIKGFGLNSGSYPYYLSINNIIGNAVMDRGYRLGNLADSGSADAVKSPSLRELQFYIEYKEVETKDTRVRSIKEPTARRVPFTFIAGQTDSVISSEALGDYMGKTVSRVGQPLRTKMATYHHPNEAPKIGSVDADNYFLMQTNKLYYLNDIICEHILSKDYVAIAEQIGLNSSPRVFEMPSKSAYRNDYYSEYLVLSKREITPTAFIDLTSQFLGVLNPNVYSQAFNNVLVTAGNATDILLPLKIKAHGKSILFTFNFKNNYSAGQYIIERSEWTVKELPYNNEYPDGSSFGEFDYLAVRFIKATGGTLDIASNLPKYTGNYNSYGALFSIPYYKNAGEEASLTYQLHVTTDDVNIVIGKYLTKNNPLIGDKPAIALRARYLTREIGKNENINVADAVTGESSFSAGLRGVSVPGPIHVQYKGWAIVDMEDNLYLAVNGRDINRVYFNALNKLSDLYN